MDLDDVAVFAEATQTRSLAAAARRLGIAPMAASRRLAALEQELGVRLLHRTTRTLALTPEGDAFLPHAQAMLEDEGEARASVRPAEAGASGLLRLTASVPFGRKVVAPLIPAFLHANPDVRVDLLLSDGIVDIAGQGIDLAIRIAHLRDSNLIARKLAANPRVLCASPDYLAEHGLPRMRAELAEHACLSVTGTRHWDFVAYPSKPVRQRVSGRFTASSPEALLAACLGGAGIAMLSDWSVADDVAAGRLVRICLEDGTPDPLDIWAVYPTSRLLPAKTRLFIAALEESLAAG